MTNDLDFTERLRRLAALDPSWIAPYREHLASLIEGAP